MNDLISRQTAIDYFVTNVGFHDEDGYPIEDECELREIWTGYFDGIPSAELHWIPCSERIPEVRQWVLCQCRAGIMDVLRLTEDGSWYKGYPNAEYMGGFVVAWMPLPNPYKGDKE